MATTELTDTYMLKQLVKQANGFGASLRIRKHKKYPIAISGKDETGRQIRISGNADFLYITLLKELTNYF